MRTFLLILPLLAACAEDVAKDKAQATVTEPPPAPAAPPAAAPAAPAGTAFVVDKAKSKIGAVGAKVTGKHDVNFPEFEGKVSLDGENLTSIEYTVQMAALVADAEKLTAHLKDADFFAVDQFTTSTFKSAEIKAEAGADGVTHQISGDLTLHGVTQRITFPAKVAITPTEITGRAEFAINRKDFGIVYPGKPDDLIQDNVVLTIELAAPRS
jgi:polyisoprenoid-binding protein YceI